MTTPNPDTLLKITKARAAMIIDQPFFGVLALRLRMKVMPESMTHWFINQGMQPTLAVDGTNVFYSEKFVDNLEMPLLKSAIAHEVGHCVFDHMSRRGSRNPRAWNQAGDFVINAMLKDAGFEIGSKWLYNPSYAGMSTDEIYNSFPPGDGPKTPGDPLDNVLEGESGKGIDPAEAAEAEADWKVATIQAAKAAQSQGKLPASIQRFVDELTKPYNDWRERLRRFVNERAKDEYCWSRPNRRYLSAGLYLPSLYSEQMGSIVIVTDDSGSIGDDILALFGGEISSIRDAVRPRETVVISCDARVNYTQRIEPDEPFKLQNHGGGGTDFRPPFKWVEEQGIRPSCLVYLTDMYGAFPDKAPDYPVMWCAITDVKAPWGETIRIESN